MKKTVNRFLSTFLVMCMLVLTVPVGAFAEPAADGPVVWESSRISELTTEEMGEGVIYVGTSGGRAEEKGQYVLTLYRDGYSDGEATVELHTVDVSAKVGVDYQIIGEETEYKETSGTVMELNANYDAEDSLKAFEQETEMLQNFVAEEAEESVETETAEKSPLAQIKEEKTGMPTREVTRGESTDVGEAVVKMVTPEQEQIAGLLNEYAMDNMDEFIESSSVSYITFMPGETEKQILIEVCEDEEPEADEIAYLFLAGASGALVGDIKTTTVTIADDEEEEDIFLSLSDDHYTFGEGEFDITINRTGALYEMVSADVRLDDESVQTVMFKPYDTEKKVTLSVSGSGTKKVTLENFKGCSEGDITEADIAFGELPEIGLLSEMTASTQINDDISLLATTRTNKVSFTLETIKGHNGHSLRVDYVPGQYDENGNLYGKIMDTGRNPEAYIGRYYFPSSFSHGKYTGYGSPSERSSKHGYNSDNPSNEPGGYSYLHWYDWRTWKNGTSYSRLSNVNHRLYQYYAVDWHQTREKYGGQNSRFKVFKKGGYSSVDDEPTVSKGGSFDRQLTSITALSRGENPMPQDAGGYLEAHAQDNNGNRTPIVTLYVYGIAAFFRKFDVSINQPAKMKFWVGDNQSEYKAPLNVALGEGHNLRYTEQSIAVRQNAAYQSGIIPAELIGYKFVTNPNASSNDQKTFYYMASGKKPNDAYGVSESNPTYYNAAYGTNMESIYLGNDFITNKIDKNLTMVSGSGTNWSTQISLTPLYRYKDATVQILSNANGKFTKFDAKTYYDYNIGDTLVFNGTPKDDSYIFAGYKVTGRATTNANEQPIIDETVWAEDGNQLTLLLGEKNCTYYQVEPVFKKREGNYITVNDQTDGKVNIYNLLSEADLQKLIEAYPGKGFTAEQKIVVVNPSAEGGTDAEKILNSITVKSGEIYQLQAEGTVSENTYYKPTFRNQYFTSHTVTSNVFDYVAASELSENVITVGYTSRDKDSEEYMELKGSILSADYSIRQSAATQENVGIEGLSVMAGDRGYSDMWVTIDGTAQKIRQPERASDVTAEGGTFELSGILGYDTDAITMVYNGGSSKGVRVINLSELKKESGVMTEDEISYSAIVTNDTDKTNSEEIKKVNGKIFDLSKSKTSYYNKITTPIFATGSPVPTNIDYRYLSGANVELFGTSENSIAIMDDQLTLSLTVDRHGHQIKKVVFTVDKQRGSDLNYTVEGKINQEIFTCNFDGKSMKDLFEDGDRIYVTLYDAEEREVITASKDENGNEIQVKSKEEIVYNKIFTGLTMYVPMLEVVPQEYKLPDSVETEVPILGKTMSKTTSGVVSFSVQEWEGDEGADGLSVMFDASANLWTKNGATTPQRDLLKKVKETDDNAWERAKQFAYGAMEDSEDVYDENSFFKNFSEEYDSVYDRSLNEMFNKNIIKLNLIILMQFDFMYSSEHGKYIFIGGQLAFGGNFSIKRTIYWVCGGVPVYLQLGGDVAIELQASYGENASLDYDKFKTYENVHDAVNTGNSDVGLFVRLGGRLAVGTGICGVIGARGIVEVDVRIFMSFMHIEDNSGIVGSIEGGLGIDLVLFSFEYTVGYRIGCGIYEDESGWLASAEDEVKLENIRTYNAGDGTQVGGKAKHKNGYNILVEHSAEYTRPHVVALSDGKKLLVYMGTNPDRDVNINKNTLYYSIYENGKWSDAQILDDDGTADGIPDVYQYGDKVVVAWSDATREFTQEEVDLKKYKEMLSEIDISAAVFSEETGSFGEVIKVSDDEANYNERRFLDYGPVISVDEEGRGLGIFYIKRDILQAEIDQDMVDSTAVYETIAYTGITNEKEVVEEHFMAVEGDPLMINLDAATTVVDIGGEEHYVAICTYVTDRDNDLTDNSDWDVYLMFHDATTGRTYAPVNLCNDFVPDSAPKLTNLNGNIYLTYISNRNDSDGEISTILNYGSVTDVLEVMQHGAMNEDGSYEWELGFDKIFADGSEGVWYRKTAVDLGLSDEQYEGSIFETIYNGKFTMSEADMKVGDEVPLIGKYEIVEGKDDKVYILWTDTGSTKMDDYSIELYGAVSNPANEDERSGWSKPVKLTNFSDKVKNSVIDEFSVAVDENGEFTLVSNMYTQNLEEGEVTYTPNMLISFTLDESGEPIIYDDKIEYDSKYPAANQETEIKFAVRNDGLQSLNLTKATISVDGAEDVVVDINHALFGGETEVFEQKIIMPEKIDAKTKIKITVETKEGKDAVIEQNVPYGADYIFTTKSVEENEDGTLGYVVEIENIGNKESGDFNLDVQKIVNGEGLVGEISQVAVKSVKPGESAICRVNLKEATLTKADLEEGVKQLKLSVVQSGTEMASETKYVGKKLIGLKYEAETPEEDEKPSEGKPVRPGGGSGGSGGYYGGGSGAAAGVVKPALPFVDVKSSDWFYNDVKFAYDEGLVKGTSETTFEPESPLTRGMLVTLLYRMEGEPAVNRSIPFADVDPSAYYGNAVSWAQQNGIVKGYSETEFAPDENILREQIAAIMHRYATYKGTAPEGAWAIRLDYSDLAEIEEYAVEGAMYCKLKGIMQGKEDNNFAPKDNATRAETAAILHRYIEANK